MPKKQPPRRTRSDRSIMSITYWRKFATHRLIFLIIAIIFGLGIVMYFGASPMGGSRSDSSRADYNSEVLVTANGEPVNRGEYNRIWEMMRRQQMPGGAAAVAVQQGMVVKELIDAAILRAEAAKRNISVSGSDIDEAIAKLKASRPGMSGKSLTDDELLKVTSSENMSDLRDKFQASLLPEKLGELLSNSSRLTEDDLRKTYDEIDVRHILIGVQGGERPVPGALPDAQAKAKAEKILAEVNAGKDFAALANQYTNDPSNAATKGNPKAKPAVPVAGPKGGSLGWYKRGSGFAAEFEDAAFALKKGEHSGVVKTPFGYHIIQVLNTRRNLPADFDKNKAKLLADLRSQKAGEARSKFLEGARKTAKLVWKDLGMEWRYAYCQASPMAMYGMMNLSPDAAKSMETKLAAYLKKSPDDSEAQMVLGNLLNDRLMQMKPDLPGVPPTAERAQLRKEVIAAYKSALDKTEDQETRFTLARLFEEDGQPKEALAQYELVHRYLQWDETPETRAARARLVSAFAGLGKPELAADEQDRIRKIDLAEAQQRAQQAAQDKAAKEKAAREKAAGKPQAKAGLPQPGTQIGGGTLTVQPGGSASTGALEVKPGPAAGKPTQPAPPKKP